MAAVELLASGAQARTGTSTPLDVSAHAQLRLNVTAVADLGKVPELHAWIETGPASTGPWREAKHIHIHAGQPQQAPTAWPADNITRTTIGDFDAFVRVRWEARATANSIDGDPGLTLGVAGDGV